MTCDSLEARRAVCPKKSKPHQSKGDQRREKEEKEKRDSTSKETLSEKENVVKMSTVLFRVATGRSYADILGKLQEKADPGCQ